MPDSIQVTATPPRPGRILQIAAATGLLVLLPVSATVADPGDAPPSGPKEAICGFIKNFHYLDAAQVTNGLCVTLTMVGPARLNEPARMRFTVTEKPGDLAVNQLQLEHEKFMHVIGVRDDLSEFFHIHPAQVSPGIWEVPFTFANGGTYKIWTDVRYHDFSYAFAQPPVSIAGIITQSRTNAGVDRPDYVVRSGFQITFKHTEPLRAGKNANLEFLIRDAAGREIETENFLGAPMHLVIIKDDLSIYRHAHPDYQETVRPTISFTQNLPELGKYKLFAQFRPKGTSLPPDDAILAEFVVEAVK